MLVIQTLLWGNYEEIGNRISRTVKSSRRGRPSLNGLPHSIECARAHKGHIGDISLIIESAVITEFKKGIQILLKKSAKEVEPWASHLTFLDLSFLISNEGEGLSDLWGPF